MSRADLHEPLDAAGFERWTVAFARRTEGMYPALLGFVIEEVRLDYCRIRMPFSPSLLQPGGVVHGGAIASVLDAAVVPAIGSRLGPNDRFATIDQHVQYLGPLDDDAVAEGWVVKRGRRIVFCESEVVAATTSAVVARSVLTYSVSPG